MALGKAAEALPFFQQSLRLNPRFRPFTKYNPHFPSIVDIQCGEKAILL